MSLVDPTRLEPHAQVSPTGRGTVAISLAVHVAVLTAVVVVPIFGHVVLPEAAPRHIAPFVRAVSAPSIPPPAAVPPTPARRITHATAPTAMQPPAALAPVVAPDRLSSEMPPAYVPGAGTAGTLAEGIPSLAGAFPGAPSLAGTPPPPPSKAAPLRVGGDIRPPHKVHHVAPVYPAIAVQARVTGTVVLEATIDRAGVVTNVRVLRSIPLLDAAAVAAVQRWRYEPTRLNGEPVDVLLTVTVRFAQ